MTDDQPGNASCDPRPEDASTEATRSLMLFLYGEQADTFALELLNDDAIANAPDAENDQSAETQLPSGIIRRYWHRGSPIARSFQNRWKPFHRNSGMVVRIAASVACLVAALEACHQVYSMWEHNTGIFGSPISGPNRDRQQVVGPLPHIRFDSKRLIDLAGKSDRAAFMELLSESEASLPTTAHATAAHHLPFKRVAIRGATRTWVSEVGDDVNPCSRTAPCRTFAGAISKTIATGEVGCLGPGGFGAVTITKSISIRCDRLTSDALTAGTHAIIIDAGATDTIMLHGLTIEGLGRQPNGIDIRGAAMVIVERTRINGFTSGGINFRPANESANLYVKDTSVTGNRYRVATSGILIRPSSDGYFGVRIDGSRVQRATVGIRVDSSAVSAGTVSTSVYGSRLENNTGDGLLVDARFGSASTWLDDAIVANNGGIGLRLLGPHGNVASENSLIFQNAVGNFTPNILAEHVPKIDMSTLAEPVKRTPRTEFASAVSVFSKQVEDASKSINATVQLLSSSADLTVERKTVDVGSIRKILLVLLTELGPNAPLAQAADRLDSWTSAQMTRLNSERSAFRAQRDVETLIKNYQRSRQAILDVRDMMTSYSREIVMTLEDLRRTEVLVAECLLADEAPMATAAIEGMLPSIKSSIGRMAEVRAKVQEIDRAAPAG
jgi:hypothetical protein